MAQILEGLSYKVFPAEVSVLIFSEKFVFPYYCTKPKMLRLKMYPICICESGHKIWDDTAGLGK